MIEVIEPDRPAELPKIELDPSGRKIYEPDGIVLEQFLECRKHVSVIRGSIGSGTSTACIMKMWMISCEQRPNADGVRRTRWAVCRNTFPDLKNTTVKTWLDWFPEEMYGRFYWDRPFRHVIRIGDVDMEIIFLALDTEDDVRKLRSFEFTGIWFNELEFIEKAIVDEAESRTGRFPAVKDGGATWDGVIADMNAPREDHFIPLMMGEVPLPDDWTEEERLSYRRPDNWGYHVQPPAMLEIKDAAGMLIGYRMNPLAENTKWLKPGYYSEKIKGKTKQWIDSRVLNKITVFVDGKPVWEQFSEDAHASKTALEPIPGWPVYVGLDFGRNPACVVGQLVNNRWRIFAEVTARGVGASIFAPLVKQLLDRRLGDWHVANKAGEQRGYSVEFFGDPKGDDGTQADETTAYDVFRNNFGMPVRAAPVKNNHIQTRIEAVEYAMVTMVNGVPRFLVCGINCRTLKVACAGGYHFKRIKGTSRHEDKPFKDRYSDIADATQYMLLGAGEGRVVTGQQRSGSKAPVSTKPQKKSRRRGGFQ
ncbi:hypothetical protein GYN07_20935 [Rhizobium leguminosarum bv. viciae 248]|uniref:hypothetical protein n=1 Tax=Rhizobium leguminosarum TaxID=384 RepID=UPI000369E8DE|nr:hypothetical protein [Rhizobium leguminosarum]QHW26648.1 hypothetical protein GYN07_20935 [Rhizobium leguminosarum bv. viciae 248]